MAVNVQAGVAPSLQLAEFLSSLASVKPIPGGGSAAALAGAMAAGLVGMVCRITLKSQPGAEENEQGSVLKRVDELRDELTRLIALDSDAYTHVIQAYKGKQPDDIQIALMKATQTPLHIAACCGETLTLAALIAPKARKSVQSDLRVGAYISHAGLRGAIITAETNLRDLRDEKFVRDQRAHIAQMTEQAEKDLKTVLAEK